MVEGDGRVAVQLAVKAGQQRVGKGPGLVLIVPQILHLHAHLLHHLPVNGVLQRLADLHKSGDQGVAPEGTVGVASQQQLIPVGNGHDDGGADLGILDLAAFRTDHGPLYVAGLRLVAAASAVLPRAVPPVQLHGGNGGEGHLHGPHGADTTHVHILRALRRAVRCAGQIAVHAVQREHMQRVRRGDAVAKPGQRPLLAPAPQQHLALADAQGNIVGVGLADHVRPVEPVGRDILYHKTIPLSWFS